MGDLIPFPDREPDVHQMWCATCGADRTLPPGADYPGPCACGGTTRCSWRPDLSVWWKSSGIDWQITGTGDSL